MLRSLRDIFAVGIFIRKFCGKWPGTMVECSGRHCVSFACRCFLEFTKEHKSVFLLSEVELTHVFAMGRNKARPIRLGVSFSRFLFVFDAN